MTIPHHETDKPTFREVSKEALLFLLRPLVRWLSVMRVRPDTLTVIGWTLALCAAVLFGLGYARVAGLVMLRAVYSTRSTAPSPARRTG